MDTQIDTIVDNKKVTLNSNVLSYSDNRLTDALPVIFIHGFPFNMEMWKEQVNELKLSFRTITYNVRGHGDSGISDGQYNLELFVDDLMALLDYLKLSKVVLCGLSMGGYIALRAIEKYPERFNGIVLCNTHCYDDSNEVKIKRFETIKKLKTAGMYGFEDDFIKSVFTELSLLEKKEAVKLIRSCIESNTVTGICGTLLALASRTNTCDSLHKINVPALVIGGEQDKIISHAQLQMMHHAITGSELHIIPDTAHLTNLENSSTFNSILKSFLQKIEF